MPSEETATQALHRLTSYDSGREWTDPLPDPRIVLDLVPMDLDRVPWPYKRYEEDLRRHPLPAELPRTKAPVLSVLAGSARPTETELDVGQLARLLFLSSGVVRTAELGDGDKALFRASGSAGGRYPLELYAAVPEGSSLPAGVHWYDPERHMLLEVGLPPSGQGPAIVVTGIPWRTGWKYRERGYRHVYWDAGAMLAQLLALASSTGLEPRLLTRFPDATVESLVGADGVHEFAVAVVSLGPHRGPDPSGEAVAGAVDRDPLEFPLVTAAQEAGRLEMWGKRWPPGDPTDVPEEGPTTEEVVLLRSSQRRMDSSRGLSKPLLTMSMQVAMRGIDVPHWVVVHDVEGVGPGLYRWPDLANPVRAGTLRKQLYHAALDQGLARDAAFVVVSAIRTADLDDRDYREAQLAAGLVLGRLHLAAYAQGASASGMTFLDSRIPALLGEPIDGLLFTCVGVPEYTSKAGGLPGSPTPFRQVRPRVDDE